MIYRWLDAKLERARKRLRNQARMRRALRAARDTINEITCGFEDDETGGRYSRFPVNIDLNDPRYGAVDATLAKIEKALK
jgi:hypothetical protein